MFVIVVLMINLAGTPVLVGEYNKANFPTLEACNAAKGDAVLAINAANSDKQIVVGQAECLSREAADKLHEEIVRKDSI